MMQKLASMCVFAAVMALPAFASSARTSSAAADKVINRITAREAETEKTIAQFSPLIETYVQTFTSDKDLGRAPIGDHYFLGRASFNGKLEDASFLSNSSVSLSHKLMEELDSLSLKRQTVWVPVGFAQMALIDPKEFDQEHYTFEYQRRETLGGINCLVFDVKPKAHTGHGRFLGRIWVEDRDFNIVRFNGTFVRPKEQSEFIHFDSWRVNTKPDVWLPAYVYGEESQIQINGQTVGLRAQTRFWGYSSSAARHNEFTDVLVDSKDAAADASGPAASPVASERSWERQAEDNVLDRLESAGLLAPASDLDHVLETVVNNILITNNLTIEPEIRCRVMLTTPLESFAVGHTIVISRGLLDVLPDEASLATVLTQSLSKIVLGYSVDTRFAFADRVLFSDVDVLRKLTETRSADQEADADKETIELLKKSPYAAKLDGVNLFLTQLSAFHSKLPNLVNGRMGNPLFTDSAASVANATKLVPLDLTQVAALPLGSRVSVDPWSDHAEMVSAKSPQLLSVREKMPFQITPLFLNLRRVDDTAETPTSTK